MQNIFFSKKILSIVGAIIVITVTLIIVTPREPAFCFNFVHDTQFGDRIVKNPSNGSVIGPRGIEYFVPEVPALQTALKKEGFYIDEYEATGGGVYFTSFFGPSTKNAVISFQKKYGIKPTGEVDNDTIDALKVRFECPLVATTTEAVATSTYTTATTSRE